MRPKVGKLLAALVYVAVAGNPLGAVAWSLKGMRLAVCLWNLPEKQSVAVIFYNAYDCLPSGVQLLPVAGSNPEKNGWMTRVGRYR